jgi:hypothetical protein
LTAGLEYERELMIGEVLTGISFGYVIARVAAFGRNYRLRMKNVQRLEENPS